MSAVNYTPEYVLSASDVLAYGERAANEEADLNWETRALLESICASVEISTEEIPLDLADSLADLDELFDRNGL